MEQQIASAPPRAATSDKSWSRCCEPGAATIALVALGLFTLCLGCSKERRFPDQPISLICPWSVGGGTDRVARQLAAQLESELSVPVNVINAIGGGGVSGHTRGAVARPDGYTLTMITVELNMLHWRGMTNITHQDFAPLQLLNRDPAALFVRTDSRYQSLDDLQEAVSSATAKLKATGTAYGGIWHVAVAGWLDARGLPADGVNWISINGAGPSIQELLAGGVDFICCSLPEADSVLAGGQVRCLGVMADARINGFDEVPTFDEQGHHWSMAGWRGLAAPRATPPERLELLRDAISRVTQSSAFLNFMASSGFNVSLEGPSEFAQTLERQDRLFGDVLTQDALRPVSGARFGPMMFPLIIGTALLVTLVLVIRETRGGNVNNELTLVPPKEQDLPANPVAKYGASDGRSPVPGNYAYPAAVLLAIMFYVLASEPLGFIVTSALMLCGLLLVFGVRRLAAASTAIVAALLLYQVFGFLLRVPLPRGFVEW